MKVQVIASGSSGNCYLLTDSQENTLIVECGKGTFDDALRQIPDVKKISGGIVSHYHRDHCEHMDDWAKYGIRFLGPDNFTHAEQINIGKSFEWSAIPLTAEHDPNIECFVFFIRSNVEGKVIFFATDCFNYARQIQALPEPLSLAMTEVNHDRDLLDTGKYPKELKERVARTHCSVQRAALAIGRAKCTRFVLIHPSENNLNQTEALEYLRSEFPNRTFDFANPGLVINI